MLETQPDWKKYEEYTTNILNDERIKVYLEKYFGLINIQIQVKNKFTGKSGAEWQVDAYAYDGNDLILIECKHYSKNKKDGKNSKNKKKNGVNQNTMAAFAYIIKDVGAKQGILVTTTEIQSGAKKVANAENIEIIEVHQNSTNENFFVRFPKNHQAIAALTDKVDIGISYVNTGDKYITYPLPEAQQNLIRKSKIQGINRTDFSDEEILEEAKKMIAQS